MVLLWSILYELHSLWRNNLVALTRPVNKTMQKQYASSKEKSAHDAIADMCRFFPTDLEKICNLAINELS